MMDRLVSQPPALSTVDEGLQGWKAAAALFSCCNGGAATYTAVAVPMDEEGTVLLAPHQEQLQKDLLNTSFKIRDTLEIREESD